MYARVTLLEIDLVRVNIDEALATFEREVVPRLHDQPGVPQRPGVHQPRRQGAHHQLLGQPGGC